MDSSTVTLETKAWDGDFEILLWTGYLRSEISSLDYPFAERRLILNNIRNKKRAVQLASPLLTSGLVTDLVVAEDVADDAFDALGVDACALGRGRGYSLAEFVGIHACTSEYLLHISSDTVIGEPTWIELAMRLLHANSRVKVVNPVWNHQIDQVRNESLYEDDNYYYSYGFSDQCYLVRSADFKKSNYGFSLKCPSNYPDYGGESFEKRVDAWMRTKGYLRATYKHGSYLHPSFRTLQNLTRRAVSKYGFDISLESLASATGIPGWLLDDEARLLAFAVEQAATERPFGEFVEVGSYFGKSTVCIAKTLDILGVPAAFHAIDPHLGELHRGETVSVDSLSELKSNLVRSGVHGRTQIHAAKSTEAKWSIPISFLYIDGMHDYESVKADFECFRPHLRPGALIAFHDYADGVDVKKYVDSLLSGDGRFRPWGLADSLIVIRT